MELLVSSWILGELGFQIDRYLKSFPLFTAVFVVIGFGVGIRSLLNIRR